MEGLANIVCLIDNILDTHRKRHIIGGVLISVSMLFGGLALTVTTLNTKRKDDYDEND